MYENNFIISSIRGPIEVSEDFLRHMEYMGASKEFIKKIKQENQRIRGKK